MQKQKKHHNKPHVSVLLEATLDLLEPRTGQSYLDLTAGRGGHAEAVINRTKAPEKVVLVDRDHDAIAFLEASFTTREVGMIHADFKTAALQLASEGARFDMILIDLGVSSPQLDIASRGFSFQLDGPLDMRMDTRQALHAAGLINEAEEDELIRILKVYGEEFRAKRIVKAILRARPLETTKQLADLIEQEIGRRGKTHPATKTFQAIRIAVNEELRQLEETLPLLPDLLTDGGRVAIISFHSLEDRLVKQYFKEQASAGYEAELQLLTKKPILGITEDVHNPRARSAKLRAAVKTNQKQK